jgi:hypothetical protein
MIIVPGYLGGVPFKYPGKPTRVSKNGKLKKKAGKGIPVRNPAVNREDEMPCWIGYRLETAL